MLKSERNWLSLEQVKTSSAFLLLLIACAWLSWAALTGPFLFDDFPNLQHLAGLKGDLGWQSLADYMRQYGGAPGRPLSMLSFVINDDAWPSAPWAFKYTNLMLHLLIGVLVFGLARTLGSFALEERGANLTAVLTMAAWLLHPMQLSTSMLVVQRMTQLSMLFAIAGLWGYTALLRRAHDTFMSVVAIALLGLGTILAVLSKETGALAPLLAVILNATLLRSHLQRLPPRSRQILYWGTLTPVLIMIAVIASRWDSASNFSNRDFTMVERLLSECRVLISYLHQITIPSLRGGGIYHDDYIVSRSLFDPWTTLPAVVSVFALVLGAATLRRRRPVLSFAIAWFLGGHLLESTVFPLELYFEHRNYLPMFGPLFAMAFGVASAPQTWRRWLLVIATLWIAFAAWLTAVQAPIWGDSGKLTAVWAIEHPDSPRAVAQRAHYFASQRLNRQAADTLLEAYGRGVRGDSFPVQALNIACISRDTELAKEAWPLALIEVETGRFNRALLESLPKLRRQTQNEQCPEVATSDDWLMLTDKLLSNPGYARPGARNYIHVERAYLFRHRLDLDATMREFEAAWALHNAPKLAQLIAATLASAGLYEEGEKWADLALKHQLTGYQGWLSDDEHVSLRLKENLRKHREHRSEDQVD